MLIKMSVLYQADARLWEAHVSLWNIELVKCLILLVIFISIFQLLNVSAMLCGGMNNIQRTLKVGVYSTSKRRKQKSSVASRTEIPSCTCKNGPVNWYSLWCGFRRGRLFFWKMFASELWEWSMQLATFQTLMAREHISYLYFSLAILFLNVLISPWVFICRSRSPFMREFIYVVDTLLDFSYAMIAFSFLDQESDLRQTVRLLGFTLPSVYTGLLWPAYSSVFRSRSLFTAFLRNFAEHAARTNGNSNSNGAKGRGGGDGGQQRRRTSLFFILPEENVQEGERKDKKKRIILMHNPSTYRIRVSSDSDLSESSESSESASESSESPESFESKKHRSRSSSKYNHVFDKISAQVVNTLKTSSGNKQIKGLPLYIKCIEFFVAFSISVTVTVLCTNAFILVVQQDYECGTLIQRELETMGMPSQDALHGQKLWWNAMPRIVTAATTNSVTEFAHANATTATTSTRRTVPYSYNPFVPYLQCQYHLIESVVVNNGALKTMTFLPNSLTTWKTLQTLDIQNNSIKTLPHGLLSRTMVNLINVRMKGNPLYDTVLLIVLQVAPFPQLSEQRSLDNLLCPEYPDSENSPI
jgi:hypothetical protein